MIEGKKREQKRLLKQIDRETCLARIKAVMKDSGHKFALVESKKSVQLAVRVTENSAIWFPFEYEGAAEINQTEHLLADIELIIEISSRYFNSPSLIKGDYSDIEWSD